MHLKPENPRNYDLKRLCSLLNYELSTSVLYFLSYTWTITFYIAAIAAILFIPLLLKVLYKEKHFRWIVAFIFLIVSPPIIIYTFMENLTWVVVSAYVSLGLFYFYCALLRIVIPEWQE